jgi:uncharacterized protein (TIGR03066 family)
MKLARLALAVVFVLGVTAVRADEKKDAETKDKLVGTWEVTKGDSLPPGSTAEFTKDGKLKLTIKADKDKSVTIEGTFKVEGETFKTTLKAEGKEHTETLKIKSLTDKELVIEDEKGKKDTFKKSK